MAQQLILIDTSEPEWRLDERTCEVGRHGVEAARSALRSAPRRHREPEVEHPVHFAA